jgi:hypothetical protein
MWYGQRFYINNSVNEEIYYYGDMLTLNVDENSSESSLDLAVEAPVYYILTRKKAKEIAGDCIEKVKSNWETLATKNGHSRNAIVYMRPAFSLCKQSEHWYDEVVIKSL